METQKPDFNSPAVNSQLTILQGIINRMATNSTGCKTWCITVVSAILVVVADKQKPKFVWIALLPVVLFFMLDAYYLNLERCFIGSYNKFVKHLRDGSATTDELFSITPPRGAWNACSGIGRAMTALPVLPFYIMLIVMIYVAWKVIS